MDIQCLIHTVQDKIIRVHTLHTSLYQTAQWTVLIIHVKDPINQENEYHVWTEK